jgi:hypothetical protein
MNIYCKCGGEEFEAAVPATVIVFLDSSGEIKQGLLGSVYDIPKSIENVDQYKNKTYYCTSCGDEANIRY